MIISTIVGKLLFKLKQKNFISNWAGDFKTGSTAKLFTTNLLAASAAGNIF